MPALDYTVEKDGQTDVMDDGHIMTQFQQAGYPVQGVSADGMYLIGQDPAGPKGQPSPQYKVPITKALGTLGYNVKGAQPIKSDDSTVEPMLSGMVSQMPSDDNMRKAYIEHTLKSRGVDNPQVMGHGNDWHVYNPNTQQWAQLSKSPGMDMAGVASAGLALPHMLGALAGGTAGALAGSGVASVPLAAGGAALGSAAGSALEQLAMAKLDPDYAAVLPGHMSEVATGALKDAGLDAAGEGVGAPLAKVAGRMLQPAVDLAGGALDGAGSLIAKGAGKLAGSDSAVNLATDFVNPIPGVNTLGQVAQGLQLPQDLVRVGAKAPGFLASNKVTAPLFSEENQGLLGGITDALHAQGNNAEGILGGLVGGRAKKAAAAYLADPAAQQAESEAANGAMLMGQKYGITDEDALHELASGMAGDYRKQEIQRLMTQGSEEGNWGHQLGKVLDQAGAAGQGLQAVANASTRGVLRAAQGAGIAAQGVGKAIGPATSALRWAGLPWAVRYGLMPMAHQDDEQIGTP